jgi:hypothetical protein
MTFDIPTGLRDLARKVEKIRELEEWEKLDRQQARFDLPPSFQPSNHSDEELRHERDAFLSLAMNLERILNSPLPAVSPSQRELWQSQFRELKRQVDLPLSTTRFING